MFPSNSEISLHFIHSYMNHASTSCVEPFSTQITLSSVKFISLHCFKIIGHLSHSLGRISPEVDFFDKR